MIQKKLTVSNEISQKLKLASSKARISSLEVSDKSTHDQPQVAPLNFIPLTTESKSSNTRDLELRIDLDSIYLFPNYKIVPKNPHKKRKRKGKN